jgi:hypothetical protein
MTKSKYAELRSLVQGLVYAKDDTSFYSKSDKINNLINQLISDVECMARHRRISDTDESTTATINALRDALIKKDEEIVELKRAISNAISNNQLRNKELDALHYVWCDGGCSSGTHRYDNENLTEEIEQIFKKYNLHIKTKIGYNYDFK